MQTAPFAKPTLRASMLLFVTLTLSACGHLTGSVGTEPVRGAETFCAIAQPITWSARDTDQTIREVKSHNATGVALCRWKGEG